MGSVTKFKRLHAGVSGALFRCAIKYIDIPIAPWTLEKKALYAYLIARVASLLMPWALSVLEYKVAPQITSIAQGQLQLQFQAAAARVNLGYLMVCGAMALLVLYVGPYLAVLVGVADPMFGEILLWLVIGQSAPALFGATSLLMHALDRAFFYNLILGLTALFFLVCIATVGAPDGRVLAQTLAAGQLAQACVCALLLTKSGVWPGLTALFHKQIRIF